MVDRTDSVHVWRTDSVYVPLMWAEGAGFGQRLCVCVRERECVCVCGASSFVGLCFGQICRVVWWTDSVLCPRFGEALHPNRNLKKVSSHKSAKGQRAPSTTLLTPYPYSSAAMLELEKSGSAPRHLST